jgi:peptidoglycan/LPS O-acetylase OafA/YrhL
MALTSSRDDSGKYRPDIDGLRAIAVIAVIFFHARMKATSGGYIGVDVFFVISGYLITQYIHQRIVAGQFTILDFYERRVRRIIPALFFLLFAVSIANLFVLLPMDLVDFSKTEIATVAFFPNMLFYLNAGYFDTGAKLKPLLHMWSLGVEEQFYIVYPLLLLLFARWGHRRTKQAIWVIAVVSFAVSVWEVQHRGLAQAAFYLMPYRAWELLTGALLALRALPEIKSSLLRNVLAAIGVAAILVSALLFSSATSFPGLSAALPCLGTALVIYANEPGPTLAAALLSLRPIVSVGMISYSLYLWHWPTLVLAEQLRGQPLSPAETAGCVVFSLAIATLSWKFVEQPFRKKTLGTTWRALMSQAATGAAFLIGVGLLFMGKHGFVNRFPKSAVAYASAFYGRDTELDTCRGPQQVEKQRPCHLGAAKDDSPSFVLWGDSHAAALAPTFNALAVDTGRTGWIAYKPACLPLLGVERLDTPGCNEFNENVLGMIHRVNIPTVVLAGRWAIAPLGLTSRELDDGVGQVFFSDSTSKARSLEENGEVLGRGLRRLMSHLATEGRDVILVMDLPDTGVDTPRYLARTVIWGGPANGTQDIRLAMSQYSQESERVDDELVRIAAEYHVVTIDPKTQLCSNFQCLIARDGQSLYRDSHHLTTFGALQLVNLFRSGLRYWFASRGKRLVYSGWSSTPAQLTAPE